MDGAGRDGRRRPPDWIVIRAEYEGRLFVPDTICKRHGITRSQLRYRREKEDWFTIRGNPPRKADLVQRMMLVLDGQIRELEEATDMPIDKRANLLAAQVKTLDKLIEMGAAPRNVDPPTRRDMADIRNKLAERLAQSKR